jgi:hypothetical protein
MKVVKQPSREQNECRAPLKLIRTNSLVAIAPP